MNLESVSCAEAHVEQDAQTGQDAASHLRQAQGLIEQVLHFCN